MDSGVVVTSMIDNGQWDRQDAKFAQRRRSESIRNLPRSLSDSLFFLGRSWRLGGSISCLSDEDAATTPESIKSLKFYQTSRFDRATSPNQRALSLGVRTWVAWSVRTIPNRLVNPSAHSQLSIRVQRK